MPELNLSPKIKNLLSEFSRGLEGIYGQELISVILYGSGASGEFVESRSNLNLLVVLKDDSPVHLKMASGLVRKPKFKAIKPLFFSREYINNSLDVFPIEFLDMKENYSVLSGLDILKDISVDTRNLRFQCEQELKLKLIRLRQLFLLESANIPLLRQALFKAFTSVMHILRNVIRLKGRQPPYLKDKILDAVASEFQIDKDCWFKILSAKNNRIKLASREIEALFTGFLKDLKNLAEAVDKL